jgi:hypothetical protein
MAIRTFLMSIVYLSFSTIGFLILSSSATAEPLAMAGHQRDWCCTKLAVPASPTGAVTLMGSGNYTLFNPSGGQFGALILTGLRPGLLSPGNTAPSKHGIWAGIPTDMQGVTQMGAAPQTLTVPKSLFDATNSFGGTFGTSFTFLSTMIDVVNETAMFAAGGGPGATGFCRAAPATGTNPQSVTGCVIPGGGGDTNFPWRIEYVPNPGGNQYGGTMRLLGIRSGVAKFKPLSLGGLNRNVYFSFTNPAQQGSLGEIHPLYNTIRFTAGGVPVPITIPTPSGGTIMAATLPNTSFVTGGPLTTGLVKVSVTRATSPFLYQVASQTGYDNRDAAGHGNIQMVSPVVYTNTGSNVSFPRVSRLRMTLPEPTLAWMLGAGAVSLVALGGRRRKRTGNARDNS